MRSTRGSIIDQALQRVGNTTVTLVAAARFRLNRILQELQQGADWPFLWQTATLTIDTNGAVSAFPAGFLKPEDDVSLQITTAGGQPHAAVVVEVDHRHFALNAIGEGQSTVPRFWTIDYAIPAGKAWPRPRDGCVASFRYKFLPPDFPLTDPVAYDADTPLFPYDTLLSDLLFEWAMSYEVDPRRGDQYTVNVQQIMQSRGSAFPEKSYPTQVQLDPTIFTRPFQGN